MDRHGLHGGPDSAELDEHAVRDLREMERVGSNETVNVVVQINRSWPGRPQRYKVLRGTSQLDDQKIVHAEMGKPATLGEFLLWSLRWHPAQHYFLVLWGHAYSLGFGRDHDDPLTLAELKDALGAFRQERSQRLHGSGEHPALDLLGANACAMSYAEAAYELQDQVKYLVASQIAVPFAGWPYTLMLKRINGATQPECLGKAVIDSYVNHFAASSAGDRVAMTLLNIGAVKDLKGLVSELALRISAAIASNTPFDSNRVAHVRTAFLATAAGDVRPLIDLYDLCEELQSLCADLAVLEDGEREHVAALREAAAELLKFVEPKEEVAKMFATASPDSSEPSSRLVVFHKRHPDLDGLHGLGIFAPFVTDDEALKRLGLVPSAGGNPGAGRDLSRNLDLVRDTLWPQLVFDNLRQELSPDIVEGVEVAGTTTRGDRSAIAQMLISVDSAFNKFDRTLATTKARADLGLREAKPEYAANTQVTPAGLVARFRLLRLFQAAYTDAVAKKNSALELMSMSSPGEMMLGRTPALAGDPVGRRSARCCTYRGRGDQSASHVGKGRWRNRADDKASADTRHVRPRTINKQAGPRRTVCQVGPRRTVCQVGPRRTVCEIRPRRTVCEIRPRRTVCEIRARRRAGEFLRRGGELRTERRPAVRAGGRGAGGPRASRGPGRGDGRDGPCGTARSPGSGLHQQLEVCRERIASAFRILDAASSTARRTLRRVLADPVYGLGPGLRGIGLEERQELADVGGLSSRNLVLL